MPAPGKSGRYHHGDLRAALIDTAIEIISERGVRNFSLAEASRRLGVAASAPYAHFADRDGLLAAVAVHAYELFCAEVLPGFDQAGAPQCWLAAMGRGYVRFAAANKALFEVLYEAGLDKAAHPEIEAAERPLTNAFLARVRAVAGDSKAAIDDLAHALEATALGHAMLMLDDGLGQDEQAVALAAERAARATLALVESRSVLSRPAGYRPSG